MKSTGIIKNIATKAKRIIRIPVFFRGESSIRKRIIRPANENVKTVANVKIINIDLLTYASDLNSLKDVEKPRKVRSSLF